MKNESFIEGQISIFDLPAIEVLEPKEIIKYSEKTRSTLKISIMS